MDLENWEGPASKDYTLHYANKKNKKVVEFTFRVIYTYGGSYQGHGKFLNNVTITPTSIKLASGYHFTFDLNTLEPINIGTKTDPIAGIQMELRWLVESSHRFSLVDAQDPSQINSKLAESSETFFIRGDGVFQKMKLLKIVLLYSRNSSQENIYSKYN